MSETVTRWMPAFRDWEDNHFIILARNMLFSTEEAAVKYQLDNIFYYVALGMRTAGTLKVEVDQNNKIKIDILTGFRNMKHADSPAKIGIFSGPKFDAIKSKG